MTITVKHRCGFVETYENLLEMFRDLRAMYQDAEVDRARALVWADGEGVPVAEIVYGGDR